MNETNYLQIKNNRADYTYIKNLGLLISQWLPCPPVIWVFALDDNLVKTSPAQFLPQKISAHFLLQLLNLRATNQII